MTEGYGGNATDRVHDLLREEAAIEPDQPHTGPVKKDTQIIAIYGKGGIGKSFTLANLSCMLAQLGKKVLPAPTLEKWLEAIKEGEAPGNFAVGQGMLFADLGLSEEEAFAAHNYGTASTVLGASLRLMRVDHMQTQKILFEVSERADLEYQRVRSKSLDEMASYTPALDILAAVHVKAHVRLFMN